MREDEEEEEEEEEVVVAEQARLEAVGRMEREGEEGEEVVQGA
jgi:hypothetical protein